MVQLGCVYAISGDARKRRCDVKRDEGGVSSRWEEIATRLASMSTSMMLSIVVLPGNNPRWFCASGGAAAETMCATREPLRPRSSARGARGIGVAVDAAGVACLCRRRGAKYKVVE